MFVRVCACVCACVGNLHGLIVHMEMCHCCYAQFLKFRVYRNWIFVNTSFPVESLDNIYRQSQYG